MTENKRAPEVGRVKPPYGGQVKCRNDKCKETLNEDMGAYIHRNSETGSIIVFCGACSMKAQFYDSLRYPLIQL